MEKKRYDAIDGLRTIAAISIVMMHMRANNAYVISGFIYNAVIPIFTNFTFLFMVISAFSMCCGYYEKVFNNGFSASRFYAGRFQKTLPCFAILVFVDVIASPSKEALYEGFADLTLLFGLLPGAGNISVIGVGWFIGLIFVFYLCFPFFCCLLESKKRAWICFGISLIYNFVCTNYFDVDDTNILYCGCFFMAGGLVYLYRDQIERFNGGLVLAAAGVAIIIHYIISGNMLTWASFVRPLLWLAFVTTLLMYAVSTNSQILSNRFTRFFSSISLEVYLGHMAVFRVVEKLGLNAVFGNGWIQYIMTVILVTGGAIVFAVAVKKLLKLGKDICEKMKIGD